MKKSNVFVIIIFFCLCATTHAQTYTPDWGSLDKRAVPQWFSDAKFGIFIHWGVYSVPSWAPSSSDIPVYAKYAEWYWPRINGGNVTYATQGDVNKLFTDYHNKAWGEKFKYQDFAPIWKAEHFDPDSWSELFKKAGARYVILTSKHHEGFTLWPSDQSWNWNSVDIGPHRDLCGDLSRSVKNAGLRMGFYYSLYEWFNPLYRKNLEKYVDDHMIPQMKDLVNRYQPDVLWTDGEWDHPSDQWKSTAFLTWLFNESPVKNTICVNDRWGKETRGIHGGYHTTEYDTTSDKIEVGEKERPWEECRGIGTSFGYNRMETMSDYMTSEALVKLLVSKVSAGGNLLLDVGPTADGLIPVVMQERLLDMGKWLGVNGEAIYGSRQRTVSRQSVADNYLYFTTKEKELYCIFTQWVDKIEINLLEGENLKNVSLLGYDHPIQWKRIAKNKISIVIPKLNIQDIPCQFAWTLKMDLK